MQEPAHQIDSDTAELDFQHIKDTVEAAVREQLRRMSGNRVPLESFKVSLGLWLDPGRAPDDFTDPVLHIGADKEAFPSYVKNDAALAGQHEAQIREAVEIFMKKAQPQNTFHRQSMTALGAKTLEDLIDGINSMFSEKMTKIDKDALLGRSV